jgi:hypothetical protein
VKACLAKCETALILLFLSVFILILTPSAYALSLSLASDKEEHVIGDQCTLTVSLTHSPDNYYQVVLYMTYPNGTTFEANMLVRTNVSTSYVVKLDLKGAYTFQAYCPIYDVYSNTVTVIAREPPYEEAGKSFWDQFTGALWGTLTGFWNFINSLWKGLTNAGNLILTGLYHVARLLGDTWNMIIGFFGNWGDPSTYQAITLKALSDPIAQQALAKPDTYTVGAVLANGDKRTISQITPSGFLGTLSYLIFAAQGSWPIIEWIFKNIILVHAVIVVCLLVYGLYASVQKRDIEPIVQSFHWIYGIFATYVKIITWIIGRAIDLAQAIAQWLDTIIPF